MRMFALFTSLFVWSFLFAKEDKPIDNSLLEKREINGEEIYFLKDKNEPFTGKSVELYDNGNKWVVNYSKGKIDGLSVYSYPNGAKAYIDFYENGKMVYAKSWKPDGSICDVTNVVDGEGVAQTYHPNGPIEWRANIKNGHYNGVDTWWYENGQKERETNYKDGKKEGVDNWWYENGQKKIEAKYKDGKQDGLTTHWYKNGEKKAEANYEVGKQDGLVTQWYENGKKKVESSYKAGEADGITTHWQENGQMKEESNYKNGKKNGLTIIYDVNGKETLRRHYLNGAITLEHKSR